MRLRRNVVPIAAWRGRARLPPPRRVLVDFSLIGHRTHVTGIPRVAYAYLEEGCRLAARLGLEVLPVYPHPRGLVDARPFLVQSNWRRFLATPGPHGALDLVRSGLYFGMHAGRVGAASASAPGFNAASTLLSFSTFDWWRHTLERTFQRGYRGSKEIINRSLARPVAFTPGDILFMPAYWHDTPPRHYKALAAKGLRLCPLVHDVLPITHAEAYESPWREQFRHFVLEVLRNSDHVYFVSHATRDAVRAVCAEAEVPLPSHSVLHHGRDGVRSASARPRSKAVREVIARGRPLFLMVGSIEPKKNHLRVLEEFEALWRAGVDVELVVVGKAGWKHDPIRDALRLATDLHPACTWLDAVTDGDLWFLYRQAAALIQASEAEGFGLPIIEALSAGTKVLANDLPVFREMADGHAHWFDVHREGDLGRLVANLPRLQSTSARFAWPTWEERAGALFEDLLARFGHRAQASDAQSQHHHRGGADGRAGEGVDVALQRL